MWEQYNGYKIRKIIVITKHPFKKKEIASYDRFISFLNNVTPSLKIKSLKNHLLLKENQAFSSLKLKFSKKNLSTLPYIKKFDITIIEVNENTIDIRIVIIKKFSWIISPFGFYIGCFNILRCPSEIYLTTYPLYSSFSDFEINFKSINIENTNNDLFFDYKKFYRNSHMKILLQKNLKKNNDLGYGLLHKVAFKRIKVFNDEFPISKDKEDTYHRYDYSYTDFWTGYNLLKNGNYLNYKRKFIITLGANNLFYNEKIPFLNNSIHNYNSLGIGFCLLKKDFITIDDSYGYNNEEIIDKGFKYHIFFGLINHEVEDYKNYLGLKIGNGFQINKLGYFYFNAKYLILKNNTSLNLYHILNKFGYISNKIPLFNEIGTRQLLSFEYLYRGDLDGNIIPLEELKYFTYFWEYYSNVSQFFKFCYENIIYNPLKIIFLRINPFFFFEYFSGFGVFEKKLDFLRNNIVFGGGLTFNIFGISLKLGLGYSPTLEYKKLDKTRIFIKSSCSFDCANLNVSSPTFNKLHI